MSFTHAPRHHPIDGALYLSALLLMVGMGNVLAQDFSPPGIRRTMRINPSSDPQQITPGKSKVFFVANDGAHGEELWIHEPDRGRTKMVAVPWLAENPSLTSPTAGQPRTLKWTLFSKGSASKPQRCINLVPKRGTEF